ncbi:MAG TPA: hypothetical protein PK177_05920, partial [Burkholderiaceae bacterium]|nr:hypothetical protein [Burkholderiaceae bacterium]
AEQRRDRVDETGADQRGQVVGDGLDARRRDELRKAARERESLHRLGSPGMFGVRSRHWSDSFSPC